MPVGTAMQTIESYVITNWILRYHRSFSNKIFEVFTSWHDISALLLLRKDQWPFNS